MFYLNCYLCQLFIHISKYECLTIFPTGSLMFSNPKSIKNAVLPQGSYITQISQHRLTLLRSERHFLHFKVSHYAFIHSLTLPSPKTTSQASSLSAFLGQEMIFPTLSTCHQVVMIRSLKFRQYDSGFSKSLGQCCQGRTKLLRTKPLLQYTSEFSRPVIQVSDLTSPSVFSGRSLGRPTCSEIHLLLPSTHSINFWNMSNSADSEIWFNLNIGLHLLFVGLCQTCLVVWSLAVVCCLFFFEKPQSIWSFVASIHNQTHFYHCNEIREPCNSFCLCLKSWHRIRKRSSHWRNKYSVRRIIGMCINQCEWKWWGPIAIRIFRFCRLEVTVENEAFNVPLPRCLLIFLCFDCFDFRI